MNRDATSKKRQLSLNKPSQLSLNSENSPSKPQLDALSSAFSEEDLHDFLSSGWFLALNSKEVAFGWGEFDFFNRRDDQVGSQNDCALFAPDFYLKSATPWRATSSWAVVERSLFVSLVFAGVQISVNSLGPLGGERFQWLEPDERTFQEKFHAIRDGMSHRGLKKAVPVVFATSDGQVSDERKLQMLKSAFSQPEHLFPYGFWTENDGMMGVTPEILFTQTGLDPLETVALAGTRARASDSDREALLNDPKERHEHQLVIDDIRSVLGELGQVEVGQTGIMDLPSLFHLRTPIRVNGANGIRFEDKAHLLHPTPALGVAPRALGFDEMLRWDDARTRRRYGAPFGVSLTRLDGVTTEHCVVAIRNIQWHDNEIILGSGCGVVPESQMQREWRELELKRESVKRMLSL